MMRAASAAYWIQALQLIQHPEGGYYREVYRAGDIIRQNCLPERFNGDRPVSTSIYFLLEGKAFSAFHRIASDELWHFYAGESLSIYEIENDGHLICHLLGSHPELGESFQVLIKAGSWFGSRLTQGRGFALTGCTVSPGFDFRDFELAERDRLVKSYPEHRQLITSLTR